MTDLDKDRQDRIRLALASAHRERAETEIEIGESWRGRVMGRIRGGVEPDRRAVFQELFGRFVWRVVPIGAALVFGLVIVFSQMGVRTSQELAGFIVEEPVDLGLYAYTYYNK